MELQKIEYYTPADLVTLLNESGATLKEVAEATKIPFATLSNYRYGKTDADSMPHRVVIELSDFFRRQQRATVDLTADLIVGLPTDFNSTEFQSAFKQTDTIRDLYVLHEMTYRHYNLDNRETFDNAIFYISKRLHQFMMKEPLVYQKMISDLQTKNSYFIVEDDDFFNQFEYTVIAPEAHITIPDHFSIVGNEQLSPNSHLLKFQNRTFEYFIENVLLINTKELKKLYKTSHPQIYNIYESFLSVDFDVLNHVSESLDTFTKTFTAVYSDISFLERIYGKSYNELLAHQKVCVLPSKDETIVNELTAMTKQSHVVKDAIHSLQKTILKHGVYVRILLGRYDELFNETFSDTYRLCGNLCSEREGCDINKNPRLTSLNKVSFEMDTDKALPQTFIRPVDFDWETFINDTSLKTKKLVLVKLIDVAGLSVIKSITYVDKKNQTQTYYI